MKKDVKTGGSYFKKFEYYQVDLRGYPTSAKMVYFPVLRSISVEFSSIINKYILPLAKNTEKTISFI